MITLSFALAIFTCVLCNCVIDGTVSWSLYPVGACALAWAAALPLIRAPRHKTALSLAVISVLGVPFLALTDYLSLSGGWLAPLGIPIFMVSLVYLWALVFLFIYSKISCWTAGAAASMLSIPVAAAVNKTVSDFSGLPFERGQMAVHLVCALLLSVLLILAGSRSGKKNP